MSKPKIVIATPVRYWRGPEHLDEDLPHIGIALKELTLRGTAEPDKGPNGEPNAAWKVWSSAQTGNAEADKAFHAEAAQWDFEFMAAVGGLCRARNNLVAEARKLGADMIIWTDDDLCPHGMTLAEAWLRLASGPEPVAGALYCKRERDVKRPRWACSFMPSAELQPAADGLLQVAELATGLKKIKVAVYDALAKVFGDDLTAKGDPGSIKYRDRDDGSYMYGFYQNVVNRGDLLSEDYFLDYCCRCAGIGIIADTKIKCRQVSKDGKLVYPEGPFPPIPAKVRA